MSKPLVKLPVPVTTKSGIGTRAVVAAALIGCFVVAINLYYGKPAAVAVACGTGAGLVGLSSWLTYHWTSRQNDGLAMVSGFAIGFVDKKSSHKLGYVVLMAVIGILVGLIFGLTGRKRREF